ncbi:MAG: 16S rRNA (guanine(527)-N(7))-methyltransferase RsmG [Alkalilacustris sp.]
MQWPDVLQNVSRETRDRLATYASLLASWTQRINLIAPASTSEVWTRHVLDSAQLVVYMPPNALKWADLGSGGGLPGLVIAIIAAETAPQLRVTLVESDQRKAAFLKVAAHHCGVRVTVVADRAERIEPLGADVISARALAPLPKLLALSHRHLAPTGLAILPKGMQYETELTEAKAVWRFDTNLRPSQTDPSGTILLIKDIAHVNK